MQHQMAGLLELSHELLHCIFTEINHADLAALGASCKTLHSYIKGNRLLHKELYIGRYDQPAALPELDWEEELHQLISLEKLLKSQDRGIKRDNIEFVCNKINDLLVTARADYSPEHGTSSTIKLLSNYFQDDNNIDSFLCASSLFDRVRNEELSAADTPAQRQASAKLHCLYGVPIDGGVPPRHPSIFRRSSDFTLAPSACTRSRTRPPVTNIWARAKVYDLREYTDNTMWGPFMNDLSCNVDWEKMEAVMIVLGFNLRKFHERSDRRFDLVWAHPFLGATPNSYIPPPLVAGPTKDLDADVIKIDETSKSLDEQDPYGVSGTWMRVVCFLDYNDLYAFNFASIVPEGEARPAIDTEEAIRLIKIKLQVTKICPPGSSGEDEDDDEDDGWDWSNFRGERLPVVHFRGTSRSLHASWDPNANSRIRGTVRQTPEGEVRWTTFSIFHGEERWRSEGIQVGGLRSGRGVLGSWFDRDYDAHGPAGPTAFWKVSDELEEESASSIPLAFF
ncbi:hypothetical protein K431DRAFT_246856 [Polychaeton citri CBS 116435]|uniref:F-box domain-containing protein n=1 Tax=Polychaeton citri CBS 116435 TaxID=1314669 RepID=A0A9P4UQ85_9PEZI|nr:hypothetical protein K431DRAFT_246856 [Polychaeton citri CBS 116435]